MIALEIAKSYVRRGWCPIPVAFGSKNPGFDGWQKCRLFEADLAHHFNGNPQNIGVLLGEPSGGLTDVDCDSREAVALAPFFLPLTNARFGRASKPVSHWVYESAPLVATTKFIDPVPEVSTGKKRQCTIVELRGTGAQTIFPGSTHESGEAIEFVAGDGVDGVAEVDGQYLLALVSKLAAASVLAKHWPGLGARHEAELGLAGGLLRAGWSEEDVTHFIVAVAEVGGGEPNKLARERAASYTAARIAQGGTTTGWTKLSNIIDKRVVAKVREWLGINRATSAAGIDVGTRVDEAYRATELANAEEIHRLHHQDMRYHVDRGRFLVYRQGVWCEDKRGGVTEWVKFVAKSTAKRLSGRIEARSLAKFVIRVESSSGIAGVERLLQTMPDIPVVADELDADDYHFNCLNGTIDLRTGDLLSHDPVHRITKQAPVAFDPQAPCPLWKAHLDRIFAGHTPLIDYCQRVAGLCLTGDASIHELFILHGGGANGKSVFVDTLAGAMGNYACTAPDSLLMVRRMPEHPTEIADLCGKRLVVASETEEGARLRLQLVKKLTGDARMKARFMRQDFFEFRRTHKLLLVTNNRPFIGESTEAAWRRIRLIPFNVTIPEQERDKKLLEKLMPEWPGIIAWAVRGCLQWQREEGLRPPPEVMAATEAYREDSDPLGEFIAACCLLGPALRVARNELFDEYQTWCDRTHEPYAMNRTALFNAVRRVTGVAEAQPRLAGTPIRVFTGIGLRSASSEVLS